MRLTIVPSDSVVGIDRVFRKVDLSNIDPQIHAVQFDDTAGEGEIEFKQRGRANERITDRSQFAQFIDRWTAAAPLPPAPPSLPVDRSGLDKHDRAIRASMLAAAALTGKTPAEAKIAFKQAWDSLSGLD